MKHLTNYIKESARESFLGACYALQDELYAEIPGTPRDEMTPEEKAKQSHVFKLLALLETEFIEWYKNNQD